MNKDKRNNIKLLGTLNNSDESGIIANANQVYDANEDKSTQDVSKEHTERIKTLEDKEDAMQTTLENISKTGEASAASNVTYNHSDSKLDATNVQQAIDEIRKIVDVFDISAYHATGGTLATYDNLEDALGTNGKNIPQSLRKGGMSVKFVQTSDNKYVQYRLMSDTFNTTPSNWQGVDDVPTAGSENLVKSGGVYSQLITKNQTAFTDGVVRVGSYNANQFIKEIYITGWDGTTELLFEGMYLEIQNNIPIINLYIAKFENNVYTTVCQCWRSERNHVIFLDETNSSGITAYVCIDYNLIDENVPFNRGQSSELCPRINRNALSLMNCPNIRSYLHPTDPKTTNTNSATDYASTKILWDDFIYYKKLNGSNLFNSWETANKRYLEQAILSIKLLAPSTPKNNLYLCNIYYSENNGNPYFIINLRDGDAWASYNKILYKKTGITQELVHYNSYAFELTINWDVLENRTLNPIQEQIYGYKKNRIGDLTNKSMNIIMLDNIFKQSCTASTGFYDYLTKNNTLQAGLTISQESDGVRVRFSSQTGEALNLETAWEQNTCSLLANHTYLFYLDFSTNYVNPYVNNSLDSCNIALEDLGASKEVDALYRFVNEILVDNNLIGFKRYQKCSILTVNELFLIRRIRWRFYNNNSLTGNLIDVTIHNLFIVDCGINNVNLKSSSFLELFKESGYFERMAYNYVPNMSFPTNTLYRGLKLKSLGDSIPETKSFQPYIADVTGMEYNPIEEGTDETVVIDGQTVTIYRSVMGGTRVQPVQFGTSANALLENSIYMRAKSLKYRNPDVILIVSGYNDPHAGEHAMEGTTWVQPADYGINDPAYHGDGVNLITDPTADCPSFGASYRGMIENILSDLPQCRLILCGVVRGSGEVQRYGQSNDRNHAKNVVIEHIAKEYGFPYVDLADVYGVNSYNYQYLTKDGLHPSHFGGKRIAMEILAKAF